MTNPEALESNRLFTQAWEYWARRSRAGVTAQLPGLTAAWMNVTWPICNLTFLAGPVADAADLDARAEAAVAFGRDRGRGWIFFTCGDLLPEGLREPPADALARHGLTLRAQVTGMAADRLLPPRRPLPELDFRRVGDEETRRAFAAINAVANNNRPLEWGYEALDVPALWDGGAFAYVGYLDGEPVTTAETLALDGILYMAMVATLPEHQKKGYAEAVMRHSLARAREATGWERTVLQASRAGLPLYREMGYRTVANFFGFMA